ncbi:ArsR/SmtB family transcription factor [Gorillibacterium sp. sgz500922]|uniref:ArsR/SmtB family transcription factor n=1 Tax=Gorillibacterium sp. sgz500922 TaxID=3446694 RepID=UPI003F663D07
MAAHATSDPNAPKPDVFQALADPTRRRLLELLAEGERPLNALSGRFGISRTAVSKHLRVLADAGLVRERKAGRETRYRLDPDPLREVKEWIAFYERFWDNKLAALGRYLEAEPAEKSGPAPGDREADEPGTRL